MSAFDNALPLLQNGSELKMTIGDTITIISTNLSSCFTVYCITVNIGTICFKIQRRFRQFVALTNNIYLQWPKETFKGFPKNGLQLSKRGVIDKTQVAARSVSLQKFLDTLLEKHRFIIQHEIFIQWLNPAANPQGYELNDPSMSSILLMCEEKTGKWKERFCTLNYKNLFVFKSQSANLPISMIEIEGSKIVPHDKEFMFCFCILDIHNQKHVLRAQIKRDFLKWVESLHTASINDVVRVKRVGSDAYVPDEYELKEREKEISTEKNQKLEMAETLLRSSPRTDSPRRASTTSLTGLSPRFESSSALRAESTMNIHDEKRESSHTNADSLTIAKQDVDNELDEYMDEIEVQLMKLRFLNEKPLSGDDTPSWKEDPIIVLCERLMDIAQEFMDLSVSALKENNNCKRIIQDIQQLALQHCEPFEKKFITSLLFIISPISRLVQYQKQESLRKLPNITGKSHTRQKGSRIKEKDSLQAALSEATRFICGAMGISLIDSIKAQNAPILSPVSKPRKQKSPRSRGIHHASFQVAKVLKLPEFVMPPSRDNTPPTFDSIDAPKHEDSKTHDDDDEEEVQILQISCSICSERFPIHLIHNHAMYCDKAANACDYPPGGFIGPEHDWDSKLRVLDELILSHVNELYELPDDHSEAIKTLLPIHTTLNKVLNSKIKLGATESHQILTLFLPVLVAWKHSSTTSVFAYASLIFKILSSKFQSGSKSQAEGAASVSVSPIKADTPSVSITDFKVLKRISRGAFGRVDLVQQTSTGELFAMKTLDKDSMVLKNLVNQVMVEREILSSIENEFVVKMFYAFHNSSRLFLVMEYLPGGDCSSLLENIGYFDESMARCYIAELVMALDYLHSKDIIHRDVKPDNLLISADGHIKLTDFGLSIFGMLERQQEVDEASTFHTARGQRVVGTPDYLAPEALLGTGGGKPTIDWWSVGVTLFEFLTGIPPFNDETPDLIFENILSGDIPWPLVPEEMSFVAQDIIKKLLDPNPLTRLGAGSVDEIRTHSFFDGLDWDNLYLEPRHATFVPRIDDQYDTGYFVQKELGDSFVEGEVYNAEKGSRDNLFAGFSWVHMPSMEEVAEGNGNYEIIVEADDSSSTDSDEEMEIAALELQSQQAICMDASDSPNANDVDVVDV